ncbi:MAG TPA: ornithine cyclodeaminase [Woeseiaceae bacterium]|nr:ornithine cyclodeaminase [Woeseiaceae bacterium]
MTQFIDVAAVRRLVDRVGVAGFIKGMAAAMQDDFCRWDVFDKCPRVASHSELGVIELMPAADATRYAFKYVNGHPANTTKRLSTVMAFGALADVETGYPTLIAELTLTTAFRTAAASAMAAKALARPDSRTMGMIGCGSQSEFQAIAFHTMLGIETIRAYDIDAEAMQKLKRNLQYFGSLKIELVASAADAALGADIVTTCTADKTRATILTTDMVSPGTHVNGVGGDCPGKTELHVDLLRQSKIFVEYEPQTRIEGDIQQLPGDHKVYDLWRVLSGLEVGRDNDRQITIFDSVGFALEDFTALRYLGELASQFNEGETIELIPELNDPKNLFELVLDSSGIAHSRKAA